GNQPSQTGLTGNQPSQTGQPASNATAPQESPPPPGVEIVVLKKGWGRIRRVFEIAGGAG
ncbi:MAG: hypothetical protein HQL86_02835, partial [Magnetococcales bacterium]|nr:hypothetical protein [Magnetococcales bacterium]